MFPFNPDRVLRLTPKPPAQSTASRADEIQVGTCYQDDVPPTLVTPVLAEGLASLQNPIKQDTHTLSKASIQRLERHVQKLAYAAQISFAESALVYNQNQMLIKINNKAKVRRPTRSVLLGKAKVMSYEDIEEARIKHAAKDATRGKGIHGRKRKSAALEPDEPDEPDEPEAPEPEPEPEVACTAKEAIKGKGKRSCSRGGAQVRAPIVDWCNKQLVFPVAKFAVVARLLMLR